MQRVMMLLATLPLACALRGDLPKDNIADWSVNAVPSVVIGTDAERAGHDLFRVAAATRLSDGRIAIANAGTAEIRLYDSTGAYLGAAGGEGSGPGELRNMLDMMRLPGDTLLVLSLSPGLTWFTPGGAFVRQTRLEWTQVRVPCMIAEGGLFPLPDGKLLVKYEENSGIPGCPRAPDGVAQRQGMLARFDPVTGALDSLASLPATERNGPNYQVYGRMLVTAVGRDRFFAGETGSDSIFPFALDGANLEPIVTPFEGRPVPDSAKAIPDRRMRWSNGREEITAYDYPDVYPRFGRLMVDSEGLLWVMAYPQVSTPVSSGPFFMPFHFQVAAGGATWRIVNLEGEVQAEVTTPDGVFPLEIGPDYILGLRKDELDVQSVVLHTLDRSG